MITFEQLSCANHRSILQVATKRDTQTIIKPQRMVIHSPQELKINPVGRLCTIFQQNSKQTNDTGLAVLVPVPLRETNSRKLQLFIVPC